MQDEIYIKGPVLSPGATGWPGMTQDRPLSAKEIQKAAYQFLPGYSIIDVQHSFMKQAEVVESYVSPEQTEFNGKIYPEGTWFVTSRVTSPEIIKAVNDGELTGYSIGAFPEKQYKELKRINKSMFNDVEEGAWFPLAISIVDVPFYPEMVFKLFGPDDFIKKEQIVEDKIMSEDKTRDTLLEKIFDYFIKKEEVKEPVEEPEDVAPEFITKSELDDFKAELIEMLKSDDEDEEDEEVESEEEEVEDAGEDEEEPEEVDAPAGEPITKSLPVDQPPVVKESFNKQLGRDAFGNKIE
jgi:hypothetical protein